MGAARTDLSGEVRCGGGVDPRDEHEDDGLGGGGDRATPSAARWGISESAPRCRTAAGMARRGMSYRFCRQGRRAASAGARRQREALRHMEEVMRLRIPRSAKVLVVLTAAGLVLGDRKSVLSGKKVAVRVDLGGGRIIKQKKKKEKI